MTRGRPDYSTFDRVLVERIVSGTRATRRVPKSEAAEVVRRLSRRGYSAGQIAYLLDCPRRTVVRIQQRHHIPPGQPLGSNQNTRIVHAPSRPWAMG